MQDAPDAVVDGDIVLVAPGMFLPLFLHATLNPIGIMNSFGILLPIFMLASPFVRHRMIRC